VPDVQQLPLLPLRAAEAKAGQGATLTEKPRAVVVVAGVIERAGRLLVTRRLDHTHLGGRWEFPGGKCEPGESHAECLVRELREELDVAATVGAEILVTEHAYSDRTVRLHFRRCTLAGEPTAVLGQQMRWVLREELETLEFPEADRELIVLLTTASP
jgi:mutator protein MutT